MSPSRLLSKPLDSLLLTRMTLIGTCIQEMMPTSRSVTDPVLFAPYLTPDLDPRCCEDIRSLGVSLYRLRYSNGGKSGASNSLTPVDFKD